MALEMGDALARAPARSSPFRQGSRPTAPAAAHQGLRIETGNGPMEVADLFEDGSTTDTNGLRLLLRGAEGCGTTRDKESTSCASSQSRPGPTRANTFA